MCRVSWSKFPDQKRKVKGNASSICISKIDFSIPVLLYFTFPAPKMPGME